MFRMEYISFLIKEDKNMNRKTKHFLYLRKISLFLPWIAIFTIIGLLFSLIVGGFLTFFTEIGFIANFYYCVDEYNWVAERLQYNKGTLITHKRDHIISVIMYFLIIIFIINTLILSFLIKSSFLYFTVGICFISGIYFCSRISENILIIFKISLESWNHFYKLVVILSIILISIITIALIFNIVIYFILLFVIGVVYIFSYHFLVELYKNTENDLGGHKYFIDLPDNRFKY